MGMVECPDCDETVIGSIPSRGNRKCRPCHGTGRDLGFISTTLDRETGTKTPCTVCSGTRQCQTCGGRGLVVGGPSEPPGKLEPTEVPDEPEPPGEGCSFETLPSRARPEGKKTSFVGPISGVAAIWILSLIAVSKNYDWLPTRIDDAKLFTPAFSDTQPLAMCHQGVQLGRDCYPNGEPIRVLREVENVICIQAHSGREECYVRAELLRYGNIGTGTLYDHTRALGGAAKTWWLFLYPIILLMVAATLRG